MDAATIQFLDKECRDNFGQDSGVTGENFAPHLNGWIVNCWVEIEPCANKQETELYIYFKAIELVRWMGMQTHFSSDDNIQFVIGWKKSVRSTSRQILKVSIRAQECQNISRSLTPMKFEEQLHAPLYPGWDRGIVYC